MLRQRSTDRLSEVTNRLPEISDSQHSTIAQHEGQPRGGEAGRQVYVEPCIAIDQPVTQLTNEATMSINH